MGTWFQYSCCVSQGCGRILVQRGSEDGARKGYSEAPKNGGGGSTLVFKREFFKSFLMFNFRTILLISFFTLHRFSRHLHQRVEGVFAQLFMYHTVHISLVLPLFLIIFFMCISVVLYSLQQRSRLFRTLRSRGSIMSSFTNSSS